MTSLLPSSARGLPDLFRILESEWPFAERQSMRIEAFTEEGNFVVRCELPGVEPDDIHISVEGDQLKVEAERRKEERNEEHSEFYYGSFSRTMLLPSGCDIDNIKADYDNGIVTIRVPRKEAPATKEIPVARKGS
ncbi:Hsp20/alpha crystallin family protein [Saccharopolyspora rhizosphaerae]|uniref:Hsp20/alpha crystallin family protein n=1 Tax=Saccharopolyspora rhizosphaerae TaxID=2492662 RepID=A0A3R8R571_9PSEU|nr:Hsp20/alpha crystallin family protein [Saccharopolyspora rhizosphaerae]RRO18643.1 Hsp20/alpha crystallin family protein [Saccharopolyspora rhizosphaerae]